MSVEDNKQIVRRFAEGQTSLENAQEVVDELLAPDFVEHIPPFPDIPTAPRATSSS